ncbi:MAG: bifunctional metallophosphatase/5'-nucleotidase [Alphaproteobacteria bacterium]|nr:bifunctional metallophosphatase/5'-nucleotidase [Alphaproteobacteria bacterium]
MRKILALAAAMLASACSTVPTPPAGMAAPPPAPVTVRIIGLNDFHGNLEPQTRPVQAEGETRLYAGGAAYLASAIAQYRAQDPYSMVISAGDLISASPLSSSLFLDEPTIGVFNRVELDFNAVGNHEFDRGREELLRMQNGGCEQHTLRKPCQVEPDFGGADFAFLAANVATETGDTLFPAYGIRRFGSGADEVAVAVIGLTLEGTPSVVTPAGVEGLSFADEADTINALIPQLKAEVADAIVVSIHQGLAPDNQQTAFDCSAISGPLREILDRLDPQIDLVISGHTHRPYVCDYGTVDPGRPMLVTSASFGGTMLTDIALRIDPAANRVIGKTARNVIVQSVGVDRDGNPVAPNTQYPQFAADPDIAAYVMLYADAARDAAQRPVGRISGPARKDGPENALGNLIADAQLAATRDVGAQIALMNPGGIRADIEPAANGTITFGQIYATQPFGNTLTTKSFTGAQLIEVLQQQFDDPENPNLLSVSEGFTMRVGTIDGVYKLLGASLDGQPIDPAATYRVTMNSFLASGGDGFTRFEAGTDVVTGQTDVDALEAYLSSDGLRQVPETGRVILVPGAQ